MDQIKHLVRDKNCEIAAKEDSKYEIIIDQPKPKKMQQ